MKLKEKILKNIEKVHRYILCRKEFYRMNLRIYKIALHGIGVLNHDSYKSSGEGFFINNALNSINSPTVVDVGANVGNYSIKVHNSYNNVKVFALEPHPGNFKKLKENTKNHNIEIINKACGAKKGRVKIYDYSDKGSSHASTTKGVIEKIHNEKSKEIKVEMTTVDDLSREKKIEKIDLLKIDTEGNELNVIKGAQKLINNKSIRCIQFEFNEMNTESRTFAKDFVEKLGGYRMFRMLPNGLVDLGEYTPVEYEVFAFQNIVAIKKNEEEIIEKMT